MTIRQKKININFKSAYRRCLLYFARDKQKKHTSGPCRADADHRMRAPAKL